VPAYQGGNSTDHAAAAAAAGTDAVNGKLTLDAAAANTFDSMATQYCTAAGWSVGGSWCCTTLHSVDGLGVLACEVIEEFEGDSQ
jgi:hypothetical protein